jgi:hypothetical protein
VTAEALTSLYSLIEQDAIILDSPSKQHLQKFANAAQKSFAECAILLDENRLLLEQNNDVVWKAKVISYKDIVEAQAMRDAEDAISRISQLSIPYRCYF